MATHDLAWFLERAPEPINPLPTDPDEWGRRSLEAFIASRTDTPRAAHSRGTLCLSGAGVHQHSAALTDVGMITTGWQRAVSAVGAAMEKGAKALRGTLPADIVQRTTLILNAAPSAGSIVLAIEPQSQPLDETEPGGNMSLIQDARPLADRASEKLIDVLAAFEAGHVTIDDSTATTLRELGPRVGSTLTNLAGVISRADITLAASWAEPGAPTVRANITPRAAKRMKEFVAGRGLDAEEQTQVGTLHTVSDTQAWQVTLAEGGETVRMSPKELPLSEIRKWRIGDIVEIRARIALREQPDGHVRRDFTILRVSALDEA
ncbi:hypothetical protein [Actinomadura parmotrematis]|uniref:Uncharacterized protein n=1 Tax=Actinomadura parmotrematis TaxID=2864039 RepID=A0ABS7FXH2_9ACTN|nr:hypothetical protein [Actinomadura parmotrematis]MBW8485120.1 hypothetical protein [Actinomadura parmotrematis]